MKKLMFFVIAVVFMSVFASCQKDLLEPGIVYTDTPPESLFQNGYANTQKIWVEKSSLLTPRMTTGVQEAYWSYDPNTGQNESNDFGFWRLIQCRKFWGINSGIIYLSQGKEWYLIGPHNFDLATEKIKANETLTAYFYMQYQNPSGTMMQTVVGFE